MSKLQALTKIQILDFLGKARSSLNIKNKSLGIILQVVVVLLLALPSINFSILSYKNFNTLGYPELIITTMYVNSVILMFVLGIPFIVSIFFFARDIKFLSSLPVREDQLIFSKLSTVYVYMLGLTLLLMGPAFVVYGLNQQVLFPYSILAMLSFFLAPLLPVLIASILVLFISPFLKGSSNRNFFTIISNLLLLLVIIFIQIGLTRYLANPEYIRQAIESPGGLLRIIGFRFPPSIWLTGMINGSLKDGFYFLLLNITLFLSLQVLAKKFYRQAILAFSQHSSQAQGKIYYTKRSKGWQLFRRNILIIVREPTFFFNTLLSLIAPIIFFFIMVLSGETSLQILNTPQVQKYILSIISVIIASPAIISNLSATAITREGQAFWETKILPVSYWDNLRYRLLTTILINLSGSTFLLIISFFVFTLTLKDILLAGLFTIAVTFFLATVDIMIDVYRPLLNWTNPTGAVKNNLNVTISLAIRVVLSLVGFLIYSLFPAIVNININLLILLVSVIFYFLYIIARNYISRNLTEVFARISP